MFSRLFGTLSTLARRLLKVFVAAVVSILAGGSISTAFGLVSPKAFAITGAIFVILLTALSKTLPKGYKIGIALPVFLFTLMKLTTFPGMARFEEAFASKIDNAVLQAAHKMEMPRTTPCTEPLIDQRTGEAVKYYRMHNGTLECFDRSGVFEGEALRPMTLDVAYVATRQVPAPQPTPPPPTVVVPDTAAIQAKAEAAIQKARWEQERYREMREELAKSRTMAEVVPTAPPVSVPCGLHIKTQKICDFMLR